MILSLLLFVALASHTQAQTHFWPCAPNVSAVSCLLMGSDRLSYTGSSSANGKKPARNPQGGTTGEYYGLKNTKSTTGEFNVNSFFKLPEDPSWTNSPTLMTVTAQYYVNSNNPAGTPAQIVVTCLASPNPPAIVTSQGGVYEAQWKPMSFNMPKSFFANGCYIQVKNDGSTFETDYYITDIKVKEFTLANGKWMEPVQTGRCSQQCGGGKAMYTHLKCGPPSPGEGEQNPDNDWQCNEDEKDQELDCQPNECIEQDNIVEIPKEAECETINQDYQNLIPSFGSVGIDMVMLDRVAGFMAKDVADADNTMVEEYGAQCQDSLLENIRIKKEEIETCVKQSKEELEAALDKYFKIANCWPGNLNENLYDHYIDPLIIKQANLEGIEAVFNQRWDKLSMLKEHCAKQSEGLRGDNVLDY